MLNESYLLLVLILSDVRYWSSYRIFLPRCISRGSNVRSRTSLIFKTFHLIAYFNQYTFILFISLHYTCSLIIVACYIYLKDFIYNSVERVS